MDKVRLDVLLAERGLVESRALAQRLVMAGQVRVDGEVVLKAATRVPDTARIEVDSGPRFASRGGEKLEAALQAFPINPLGRICADVGASTGGFTDCLLQHGAARIYAIDVGYGLLHWRLRSDARVISMERTNARFVKHLPEPVTLVVVDASFISLKILLPVLQDWYPVEGGDLVALIKPQFEAGRAEADRGAGVIHDPRVHHQVLLEVLSFAADAGYSVQGLTFSPLRGPKGNVEFLVWLGYPGVTTADLEALAERAISAAKLVK